MILNKIKKSKYFQPFYTKYLDLKKTYLTKKNILILSFILSIPILYSSTIYLIEYNIRSKFINVNQAKTKILDLVKNDLGKAIEIGISDFSIYNGLIFEDIKISDEEDFSSNKILFTCTRLDLRFNSYVEPNRKIEKIIFYGGNLKISLKNNTFKKVLELLNQLSPEQIVFKNLNLIIEEDELIYFQSNKSLNLFFMKRTNGYDWHIEEDTYFSSKLNGTGQINLIDKINSIGKLKLNDYSLLSITGLTSKMISLQATEGTSDGFFNFEIDDQLTKLEGDLNFRNFKGEFGLLVEVKANEFSINSKISYYKEVIDKANMEFHYKKTISSPEFIYEEISSLNESKLKDTSIKLQIDNFKSLSEKLSLEEELSIQGGLKLDLGFKETGKLNDYYSLWGNGFLKDFSLKTKEPKLEISNTELSFFLDKDFIKSNLKTNLFEDELSINLISSLNFFYNKEKDEFSLNSNSEINAKYDNLVISDFYSFKEYLLNKVQADIKERQEKMLPESYFILTSFYKTFLERANSKIKIQIENILFYKDYFPLGKYLAEIKLSSGTGNFAIKSLNEDVNLFDMKGNLYYDRKLPAIDFRLGMKSFFYLDKVFDFCDISVYSDILDFNFSLNSHGNNFSDLYVNKSILGDFKSRNSSILKNKSKDIQIYSESFEYLNNMELKFDFNAYSADYFIRGIQLTNPNLSIYGSGSPVKTEKVFGFNGSINQKPFSLNFSKVGETCLKPKK
jgi:hypothetical protein